LKKYKPRCSKLLNPRKQTKFQWLQDPVEINGDNVNNVRREDNRHMTKKSGNIWKAKLMSLQQTVRKTLKTCIEEQINLRVATNPEVTS
jgi:hypothetical protein